ncbi:hypothetical protein LCGC14_0509470 [marine sediment metagenome]|uniref:Uncharacterized protein n=1 Tax=marine sediment metagenome TaxID=412755 RepID=A0A0F9UNA2_9ZZZZ
MVKKKRKKKEKFGKIVLPEIKTQAELRADINKFPKINFLGK